MGRQAGDATTTHRAAALLDALAHPDRLRLLAAVVERHSGDGDRTAKGLAAATGQDLRGVMRTAAPLLDSGLLRLAGGELTVSLDLLADTATGLVDALPISALLADEPDLARYFSHGMLPALPVMRKAADRSRLAFLIARLLPEATLSEPEVDRVLRTVVTDHAALRRFLVDEGALLRDAGRDYRRSNSPTSSPARAQS